MNKQFEQGVSGGLWAANPTEPRLKDNLDLMTFIDFPSLYFPPFIARKLACVW